MVALWICRLGFVTLLLGLPFSSVRADDRIATWMAQLEHDSTDLKAEALERLGTFALPEEGVRDRIRPLLGELDPILSAAASAAFLSLGGDREIVRKQLERGPPKRRAALAIVLLATDESDQAALDLFLDQVEDDIPLTHKATGLSPLVLDRMAETLLERIAARESDPIRLSSGHSIPGVDEETAEPYWRAPTWRPGDPDWKQMDSLSLLSSARIPQLIALSRSANPFNRAAATESLVRRFHREALVQKEFRGRLTETAGEQQVLMAIGILRSEPEHSKSGVLVRWALKDWNLEKIESDPAERARILLRRYDLATVALLPTLIDRFVAPGETNQNRVRCLDLLLEIGPPVAAPLIAHCAGPRGEYLVPNEAWPELNMLLGVLGEHAPAAIPMLSRRVEQGDILALFPLAAAARNDALPEPLEVLLTAGTDAQKVQLIYALGTHPPRRPEVEARVLRWLAENIPWQHGETRLASLKLWLRSGGSKDEAVHWIVEELNAPKSEVEETQWSLRATLSDLGPEAAADVVMQCPRLQTMRKINFYAPNAIVRLASDGPQSSPWLLTLLESEEPNNRCLACVAFAKAGPAARGAVPALIRRLEDDTIVGNSVCNEAAKALGAIGPAARPALGPLLSSIGKRHRVTGTILSAVSRIAGPDDRNLLAAIRPYLLNSPLSDHSEAVQAFVQIAPDDLETEQAVRDYLRRFRLHQQWSPEVSESSVPMLRLCESLAKRPGLAMRLASALRELQAAPLLDSDQSRQAIARLLEHIRASQMVTDSPQTP